MPFDPPLADRMREVLRDRAGIEEKKMFGGLWWMLNGYLICGVGVGRFMFRVGKEQVADALSRPGAAPMDMAGRPMHGFVWIGGDDAEDDSLREWVDLAALHTQSLPPK